MYDTRLERIAFAAGHMFFLAAIVLFIVLILAAGGLVTAREVPFTDDPRTESLAGGPGRN